MLSFPCRRPPCPGRAPPPAVAPPYAPPRGTESGRSRGQGGATCLQCTPRTRSWPSGPRPGAAIPGQMPPVNHRQHRIHPLSSAGRLGCCSVAALTGFLASSAAGATDRDIRHIGACVPVPTRSAWTVPLDDPDARTALDNRAVLVCDTPDGGWRAAAGSPMPTASILAVAADVSRWVEFLPYVTASAGGGPVDGPSTGTFTLEVRGHSASQTLHQGPSARGRGARR